MGREPAHPLSTITVNSVCLEVLYPAVLLAHRYVMLHIPFCQAPILR